MEWLWNSRRWGSVAKNGVGWATLFPGLSACSCYDNNAWAVYAAASWQAFISPSAKASRWYILCIIKSSLMYYTQNVWLFVGHVTSRCQGLSPLLTRKSPGNEDGGGGVGGRRVQRNKTNLPRGRGGGYGYFLEAHITCQKLNLIPQIMWMSWLTKPLIRTDP